LMGRDATEAAFKRLAPGARVLHVATHGFFLGACDNRSPAGTRGVGGLVGNAPPGASRQTPPGAVDRREAETGDPLLQSGIILAGANRGHSGVEPDHEPDDGILTAAEIAGLDLTGLDIGFLSGCDTGLGVVQAGEGVLGLRRAFRIAGARDIVISLWPVRDRDARAWVRRFYEERYLRGRDTDAAAQAADRALLKERRAQGKSTDPSRWAGFIAVSE
jgi:CHAT domain-containing protein